MQYSKIRPYLVYKERWHVSSVKHKDGMIPEASEETCHTYTHRSDELAATLIKYKN